MVIIFVGAEICFIKKYHFDEDDHIRLQNKSASHRLADLFWHWINVKVMLMKQFNKYSIAKVLGCSIKDLIER